MKFSDFLNEAENLKTKEDIANAVNRFANLENGKKPTQARLILRAAEKIGYTIKAEEILKYASKQNDKLNNVVNRNVDATKDSNISQQNQPNQNNAVQQNQVQQKNINVVQNQQNNKQIATTQQAQNVNQNQVQEKPNINDNIFFKKYGSLKLDRYPSPDVLPEDVQEFPDNVGVGPILRWKDPKSGEWRRGYDPTFLDKNADYKWDRIKNITNEDIKKIDEGTLELLHSNIENERDAGAILRMIYLSGLRPGDRSLKTGTDNRGISSLKPDSVKVNGDVISLDFIGKSTHQNLSTIEDKDVAEYLVEKLKKNAGKEFLFDISKDVLDRYFDRIARKDIKIKDLRTYKANEITKNVLNDNSIPPLPVPEKSSDIKKAVESKLKLVFEVVSKQLNNSPAMSKSSYIIPSIITDWMKKIGVNPVHIGDKKYIDTRAKETDNVEQKITEAEENSEFEKNADECDIYRLPYFFDNSNYILINSNSFKDSENE